MSHTRMLVPCVAVIAAAAAVALASGASAATMFAYGLVLACPLMMVVMMRSMAHTGGANRRTDTADESPAR